MLDPPGSIAYSPERVRTSLVLLTDAQEKAISKHAQDQLAEIYRNQAESFFLREILEKPIASLKRLFRFHKR